MQLPLRVRAEIEARAEAVGFAALKKAAAAISSAYREGRAAPKLPPAERVAAYLVTRLPATYAAARAALAAAAPLLAPSDIASVLDIGAGSGAAALAARFHFPAARLTLVEPDGALAEAARDWLPDAELVPRDLAHALPLAPHDLVLASYSLGEMGSEKGGAAALRLWQATRAALLVVEPGTPKGFAFIRTLRDALLEAGAYMLAPCPSGARCPMDYPDWCHFAARVERSSIHRRIKDAALGYEDEKFSYIAVAREGRVLPPARIVARPVYQTGLVTLRACSGERIESLRISRRNPEAFRSARHSAWGDSWEIR